MESISGQILALHDRGYSVAEIVNQLKSAGVCGVNQKRVRATIQQSQNRGLDSRRIFEIHEMAVETLAYVREIAQERRKKRAEAAARALEKSGLAKKIGAAIDRVGQPE